MIEDSPVENTQEAVYHSEYQHVVPNQLKNAAFPHDQDMPDAAEELGRILVKIVVNVLLLHPSELLSSTVLLHVHVVIIILVKPDAKFTLTYYSTRDHEQVKSDIALTGRVRMSRCLESLQGLACKNPPVEQASGQDDHELNNTVIDQSISQIADSLLVTYGHADHC